MRVFQHLERFVVLTKSLQHLAMLEQHIRREPGGFFADVDPLKLGQRIGAVAGPAGQPRCGDAGSCVLRVPGKRTRGPFARFVQQRHTFEKLREPCGLLGAVGRQRAGRARVQGRRRPG